MITIYNLEYRGDKIITHWFIFMISGLKDIFEGNPTDKKDSFGEGGTSKEHEINWNIKNKNIKPTFPIKIHFTKGSEKRMQYINDFQRETFEILSDEVELIENIEDYKRPDVQIINNYGALLKRHVNGAYPTFVDDKYFKFLRELFLSKFNFEFKNSLIYISRNKSAGIIGSASEKIKRRHILNEDELLKFLEPLGFEKIYLEDYSVSKKIEIFNTAKIIVSPHGAGLTFSLFANKNTHIIEMVASQREWHAQYLQITNALGIPFHRFLDVKVDNHINNNMIVNITELVKLIKQIL